MKLKKGDNVKIMSGKNRGKTGAIIKIFLEKNRLTVEGINLYKKRIRPKQQGQKGDVVMVARPMSASNVMLICKNCKNAVRVGYRVENDTKARYCKKCGAVN
jgi:large subunit ribosomal protein L24